MHTEATSDPSRKHRSSSEGPFPVRIRLLGGFGVWVGSRVVGEGEWHLRKAKSLVKLLALARGHTLHREQIMDLLWSELGKRAASNNLRGSLHGARRALTTDSIVASHYLASKEERVALCQEVELWVDVEAFEEAANAARRLRDPGAYRAALELYGGELLPEDRYEQWAEGRRGELLRLYLALLIELAGLYQEHGDQHSAVATLREVLAEEPTNEEAHVGLMRLYALSGQSGEALRQYQRLSEALSTELGVEPTAPTYALKEEIAAGSFPPPRSSPTAPLAKEHADVGTHNLPAQRSRFVGRERELIKVKSALATTRVLTLTGAGGSGKTRLALEIARDLVGAYPDGVWLVELAPLWEGKLVAHAVAEALGVPEQPGRSLSDALVDALREKRVLVVLDNCEHLIEEAARLVDVLLGLCPRLRVLATSREALNVEGEVVWRVPTLAVPDPGRPAILGGLTRYDAVRLFVERARLRLPDFEPTPQYAGAVVQICRKLEGMPLAIELAAARVGALSLEQISERLEDSLKLLTGGGRTTTPRQRTLRGTLDWSHELLSEEERELFRRLSAFAGGWTLEAAEAVGAAGGIDDEDILDLLSNLVGKSLVLSEAQAPDLVRYRMLESVRQYARERLEESGEAEAAQHAHVRYFLALAEEAEPELLGPREAEWYERLEGEHDNIRVALSGSLEGADPELGLRLAGAIWWFWHRHGHLSEGLRWLEAGLAEEGGTSAIARVKALGGVGWLAFGQGDLDRMRESATEGLRLSAEAGLGGNHRARFLNLLGDASWQEGDYEQAMRLANESLALSREANDVQGMELSFLILGTASVWRVGGQEQARAFYEEGLAISRGEFGSASARRSLLNSLGLTFLLQRDLERAAVLAEEAAALSQEAGDRVLLPLPLNNLGWVALLGGDLERAEALHKESLALSKELGGSHRTFVFLEGLACDAGAKGEAERAARLFGATEALREAIGFPLEPAMRVLEEPYVVGARSQLEESAWTEAWEEGRTMSIETVIGYALLREESTPPAATAPEELSVGAQPAALTRREREVTNLLERRFTSRQIASELHISEHTVDKHVAHILRKLNLHSRDQVAVQMAKQHSHPF